LKGLTTIALFGDGLASFFAFLADFGALLHSLVAFLAGGGAVGARPLAGVGGRFRHEAAAGANSAAHRAKLCTVDAGLHRHGMGFMPHQRVFRAMRETALAFVRAFEADFGALREDFRIELRRRYDGFLGGQTPGVRGVPESGDDRDDSKRADPRLLHCSDPFMMDDPFCGEIACNIQADWIDHSADRRTNHFHSCAAARVKARTDNDASERPLNAAAIA
jgi:hypothetical protein